MKKLNVPIEKYVMAFTKVKKTKKIKIKKRKLCIVPRDAFLAKVAHAKKLTRYVILFANAKIARTTGLVIQSN